LKRIYHKSKSGKKSLMRLILLLVGVLYMMFYLKIMVLKG